MASILSVTDPLTWLRNIHFAAAPFTFLGLFLALLGTLPGASSRLRSFGSKLFIGGTLAQIATGICFLSTLSAAEQNSSLNSPGDAAMFWGAILAASLALMIIHRYPGLAGVATLVTLVGMASTWHHEWVLSLQPGFSADAMAIAPETAMFLSIAMLLTVGLALAGWMTWKLLEELARRELQPA